MLERLLSWRWSFDDLFGPSDALRSDRVANEEPSANMTIESATTQANLIDRPMTIAVYYMYLWGMDVIRSTCYNRCCVWSVEGLSSMKPLLYEEVEITLGSL